MFDWVLNPPLKPSLTSGSAFVKGYQYSFNGLYTKYKKNQGNSKKELKIIIETIMKYNNNDNDYNNKIKVETRQNTATLTFDVFDICLQFDKSLFGLSFFQAIMQLNTLV